MRYGVTALFDYKTVPIFIKLPIKLFFYLSCNVAKVLGLMILEGLQGRYYSVLHFVRGHVCPFDQDALISLPSE